MVFQIADLTRDVKTCLDQNMESDALLETEDIDTLSIDELIRSKLVEAVARVHAEAPVYLLEEGHNFGDSVYWGDQESGWVLLPDDFMRLISFEMSDWDTAVYAAIGSDDPLYPLQRQRIKALRGTAQKPVCAIVNRAEGKALEFYSCKSDGAYVSRAQYLPWPEVDSSGGIDISKRCHRAAVLMAASLTLASLGQADQANAFAQLSQSLLR